MIGAWFGTDHDVAPAVIELPVDVTSGRDPGICIVDQVVRGTGIVGRVTADHGAVGLKVRSPGVATRVTVEIQLDETSTRWWSDRVRPPRTAPELPRLVLIRAQGELRGAALLARRQGLRRAGSAKAVVTFDLTAAELDGDGLLMIELAEPPRPEWATGRIAARPALGVRIDKISVRAHPSPTAAPGPADVDAPAGVPAATASARNRPESGGNNPAAPSAGPAAPSAGPAAPSAGPAAASAGPAAASAGPAAASAGPAAASAGPAAPGFAVLGSGPTGCDMALLPAGASGMFRLEVSAVPPAPPVPLSPAHKLTRRRPARAGFKVLRAARRAGTRVLAGVVQSRPASVRGVHGFDLAAGVPVALEVGQPRPGVFELKLAGPAGGPVLLGLDPGDRGLSCRIVP
ncbi:hypothetical protein [Actinoplanes sp. NPDC049599]|uniref:hypothetical protein n=1 Tax=Actinoplanes sp. NPDC049599 TaxID=3363903 RepID=UPI0037BCFAB3